MNKRGKSNIWDILAWIALAGIIIWVLLKMFGIINTPLWIEYAPVWPGIYLIGWAVERLRKTNEDLVQVKKSMIRMSQDMNKLKYGECPVLKEK
ncbi:hypothetical protein HOD75_01480 [archaeon]|jgi:hypothetical protein|nr:hypothetical protein [archaeon]MBT4241549.1 hypothetical protein [archaeon]MBT4417579.1 hypothetical protein [archaeon]